VESNVEDSKNPTKTLRYPQKIRKLNNKKKTDLLFEFYEI
jgi:hypothetical protein